MGVREVTFEEYDACFRGAGCTHWAWSPSRGRGPLPVTDVSRHDADEYTRWLSCVTNNRYRLPSDAERFAAAQQEVQRFARSASAAEGARADCRGCGSSWDGREPAPAGSFAPSELGL
jgi:formylglycine-generating enzyme required for sulfatase activity